MKLHTPLIILALIFSVPLTAQEPALPAGLESPARPASGAPSLPEGLRLVPGSAEQAQLPAGLKQADQPSQQSEASTLFTADPAYPWLSGFWELRSGKRLGSDRQQSDTSIAETRLQLEIEKAFSNWTLNLSTDLILDSVADTQRIDLENGDGWLDLRAANIEFSPAGFIDLRVGRQILTWGTGDLLFINDLFPKDWNAFFIGRDEEHLKAPSDALKASLFSELINLDVVYTPSFDPDRFIDGRRISYFSAATGAIAGRNAIIRVDRPDDDELALRAHRHISTYEAAIYFYTGRWKSPAGLNSLSGLALFPGLRTIGASLRGPLARGIVNLELGYYDSTDDSKGSDPLINNSEMRLLLGYEQEIARNLTLGAQYYLEHLQDYSAYEDNLPVGTPSRDEYRHLLTARLTWLTHRQNTQWSLFIYYSASDNDMYLRPKLSHKLDDHWALEAGANLFAGEDQHSFFGQFRDNSNAFISLRYGF